MTFFLVLMFLNPLENGITMRVLGAMHSEAECVRAIAPAEKAIDDSIRAGQTKPPANVILKVACMAPIYGPRA